MALLNASNRIFVVASMLRALVNEVDLTTVQADILAAVNTVDAWAEANAASYNAVLPEPFRTWATPKQKSMLLMYVIMRRFNLE